MSDQLAMFFVTALNKNATELCYSYQKKRSQAALKKESLMLPVDSSGSLDWTFMSDYVRVMEKLVIGDVVDWKDKELKLTRELVDGSEEDEENKAPQAAGGSFA